jgi:hypothetical protein
MGSSSQDHRDGDRKKKESKDDRRKKESKEDRLLRKAKEYIEAKESKSNRKSSRDEGRDKDSHHRRSRDKRRRDDKSDESDDDRRHHKSRKSSRHEEGKDRKKYHKKESKKEHKKESKRDKVRKPNKKNLVPLGEPLGHPPTDLLDPEKDYFAFHTQLFVFLWREEGLTFNDMTSEETHAAFERFVNRYNAGKMEATYYDPKGLPPAAVEESKTTRHTWSFRTTDTEIRSLQNLQEGVRKQTEYADEMEGGHPSKSVAPGGADPPGGVARAPEQHRQTAGDRYTDQVANKRIREHGKTVDEEFGSGGKKYGRERQMEKRREVGVKTHGAARDRDAAPELTDDAIFGAEGGGDIGFKNALGREKQRTAQRVDKRNARVAELQKKEDEKKEAMLKMFGLNAQPGQKITIAPRKDA